MTARQTPMPYTPFKYHAFISYSYQDKLWGEWLHKALEAYRIPKGVDEHVTLYDKREVPRRLYPVFRDRDELSSAGKITETVMKALGESRAMIVICSPNSAISEWVANEVSAFQKLYPERPILALVVENDPPDCFPPPLLDEQPLAADARLEGDGKPDAVLKLIGGLLGVGFGILKDREAKRRRKRMVTLVSTISAVALSFAGLTLWALNAEQEAREALKSAETQRELAEQSARESKAVLAFLNTKVMGAVRPKSEDGGLGIGVTIYDAIDAAEPQIKKAFADQPLIEASIRSALGKTYQNMGETSEAAAQYERALELRKRELGSEHRDTLRTMMNLAASYFDFKDAEALALNEESVRLKKKLYGSEHFSTTLSVGKLAGSYLRAGRIQEAIKLNEELLELRKRVLGPDDQTTLYSMQNLAISYGVAGRHEESLTLNEESLKLRKKLLGAEHPDTLDAMHELAVSYRRAGRHEDAVIMFEKVLPLSKKIWTPDHSTTLSMMRDLAMAYVAIGRKEKALNLQEEILELRKKVLGFEDFHTRQSMVELAQSYHRVGRLAEAEKQYRESLLARDKQTPEDLVYYYIHTALGALITQQKKYSEAEPLLLNAYRGMKGLKSSKKNVAEEMHSSVATLVELYEAWGKPEKAAEWRAELESMEKP